MFAPNYVAVLSCSLKTTNVREKQSHRYPLYLQPSTYSPNSTDFKMLGSAQRFTGNELFMMTPFTPITSVTESVHYGQWVFIKSIKKLTNLHHCVRQSHAFSSRQAFLVAILFAQQTESQTTWK